MSESETNQVRARPSRLIAGLLGASILTIPIVTWCACQYLTTLRSVPIIFQGGTSYPASRIVFEAIPLGGVPAGLPQITNVQILDFDDDGTNDVLCCDALQNQVSLFQSREGQWVEEVLAYDVAAPAHATVCDIDGDMDRDLIVSVLGNIMPDDSVIGRIELFEKTDDEDHRTATSTHGPDISAIARAYRRRVILDDVRRVADVQPADFDDDGDIDLAVAVFGYARGSVLWLENVGDYEFRDHSLHIAPGTIHVPVADYDGDGDMDIAAIVTQDEEELWGFENLGAGQFNKRRLWMTTNFDLGSAGLQPADLDQDGDIDLILPAGDNLEDLDAYPQPYHGCYWFENNGNWEFEQHRVSDLGGTYAADVGDLDGDGDLDIVLASMTNNWNRTDTASLVWLENDGEQQFTTWQIASDPIHLVTVAVGDLNGDKTADIVAGGLNLRKPYQRITRVHAWFSQRQNAR